MGIQNDQCDSCNPAFLVYMTYARGKDKEVRSSITNSNLIIIPEDKCNRVQQIRAGRNPENTKKHGVEVMIKNTKGEMLLIELARSGHCQYSCPLLLKINDISY